MDQHERQMREQQLMIVEALVQAMDRRDEVFQVIDDSEDVDEAIRRAWVNCWAWEKCPAGQSLTCRSEDSPETSVRPSLPMRENLDQSCSMGAELVVGDPLTADRPGPAPQL